MYTHSITIVQHLLRELPSYIMLAFINSLMKGRLQVLAMKWASVNNTFCILIFEENCLRSSRLCLSTHSFF
jgi:hypothetical protein